MFVPLQAVVSQDLGTRGGALMHVEVSTIDAVVIICPWDTASKDQAMQEIAHLDPASKNVPMRQVTDVQ